MKDCRYISEVGAGFGSERGSSAYTILGISIIVVVVIATVFVFPWKEVLKFRVDPNLAAADTAMANGQWDTALDLYEKCIKTDPSNTAAYLGRSRANLQLGDLQKALADANAVIQRRPNSAAAYGQRGIVYKILQKNEEALQDFAQAVKLDPNYAWAYAQMADVLSRKQDQEKALQEITKAIQAKPSFVEGYRLRAWILSRMGRCRDAGEDFKKVETLSPNDAWSLQDKAWFLMTCPDETQQDSSRAMELAKKALELSQGKDGVVRETLAEAYFRQGDPVKAVEHQKKAIELGSKNCPDGSCVKEMLQRLQKYEMAARTEVRNTYEILPLDSSGK